MHDLTTPEGVVAYMSEATSKDWNQRGEEVMIANKGSYPDFWFETVILSGLGEKTLGIGSLDLRISSF